jgi:uncharacterized membrane protein
MYWSAGLVLVLSLAAPIYDHLGLATPNLARIALSLFCHQMASRCWFILGAPMGLCVRCFSLLMTMVVSRILRISHRSRVLIILLAAPTVVDGVTQTAGFRQSTGLLRLVTGGLAGLALHLYLQQFIKGSRVEVINKWQAKPTA